jgi:hypothetical protein
MLPRRPHAVHSREAGVVSSVASRVEVQGIGSPFVLTDNVEWC